MSEDNQIKMYLHCKKCIAEARLKGESPANYSSIAVGFTGNQTIQVWCQRHEENIVVLAVDERRVS